MMFCSPLACAGDHILNQLDVFNLKKPCSKLQGLLSGFIQAVEPLCLPKSKKEQSPIYEQFLSILNNGVELVEKCEKAGRFNVFQNIRYAYQINQLEKEISDFVRFHLPVRLLSDAKNVITELQSLRHLYESGSGEERSVNETIVPKLTNDPHENAMMLQQMGPDDMFDGAYDEAPPCSYNGSFKSDSVMGLEKNISNLKRILFQREVSVVGVQGMGGVGKTTMAAALSEDQEIKEMHLNPGLRCICRLQNSKMRTINLSVSCKTGSCGSLV